jgi:hypothetical protein
LRLSRRLSRIKFSRATSRVKWLKVDKTDVSRNISVLVLRTAEIQPSNIFVLIVLLDRLCGYRGLGFDSRALLRIFLRELDLERGPLSLVIG